MHNAETIAPVLNFGVFCIVFLPFFSRCLFLQAIIQLCFPHLIFCLLVFFFSLSLNCCVFTLSPFRVDGDVALEILPLLALLDLCLLLLSLFFCVLLINSLLVRQSVSTAERECIHTNKELKTIFALSQKVNGHTHTHKEPSTIFTYHLYRM